MAKSMLTPVWVFPKWLPQDFRYTQNLLFPKETAQQYRCEQIELPKHMVGQDWCRRTQDQAQNSDLNPN